MKNNEVKINNKMNLIGNLIGQCVKSKNIYALRFYDESSIIKLCGFSNCQAHFNEILELLNNEKNIVIEQKRTRNNLCLGLS